MTLNNETPSILEFSVISLAATAYQNTNRPTHDHITLCGDFIRGVLITKCRVYESLNCTNLQPVTLEENRR